VAARVAEEVLDEKFRELEEVSFGNQREGK